MRAQMLVNPSNPVMTLLRVDYYSSRLAFIRSINPALLELGELGIQ
jgi:hypothetical protein